MNSVTIRLVSCSRLAPSWLISRAAHVTRRFELVPRRSPLLHDDEACDNFRCFFCASGAATRLPIIGRPTRSAAPSSFNGWMPSFKSCASSPMPLSTTATFWWVTAHRSHSSRPTCMHVLFLFFRLNWRSTSIRVCSGTSFSTPRRNVLITVFARAPALCGTTCIPMPTGECSTFSTTRRPPQSWVYDNWLEIFWEYFNVLPAL